MFTVKYIKEINELKEEIFKNISCLRLRYAAAQRKGIRYNLKTFHVYG